MTELEPSQRIQFGEAINPVKSASKNAAYSNGFKEKSISEKDVYDPEEAVARISHDDRNLKRKQVSPSSM